MPPLPREERIFFLSLIPFVAITVAIVVILSAILGYYSLPAIKEYGLGIFSKEWKPSEINPNEASYGLLIPLAGTIATAVLAVVFTLPVALGMTALSEEILPPQARSLLTVASDITASIPTIVYGLWGLEIIAPMLRDHLYTWLNKTLGWTPLFSCNPYTGTTYLTAGLLLGIIVTPYTYAIIRESYRSIPQTLREAAYAMGSTRYEVFKLLTGMIKPSITAGILLAFGRAAGETVAVALVIGSAFNMPSCLLSPGYTISSLIANQFGESFLYPYMANALYTGGLILLAIGMAANVVGLKMLSLSRGENRG